MTQLLTYAPVEPTGVLDVPRLRLYADQALTEPPTVDVSNGVVNGDGSWTFTLPDGVPDGTYYGRISVSYVDGTAEDDTNDTVTLPLPAPALPGDAITPWVSVASLQLDTRLAGVAPVVLARAAQTATEVLWGLAGRQFPGLRSATVLVLPPACHCDSSSDVLRGLSTLELAMNTWPAGWIFGCGCQVEVTLPKQPVQEVLSVSIDGVVLDPTSYRLDEGYRLVRVDGGRWPLTSRTVDDAGSPRMRVTFVWGQQPTTGAVNAAALYATELALAASGNGDCRLPDRVTSITRQDIVKTFADPDQLVENGLTGLGSVDLWVASVNPHKLSGARPRVLSPDLPRTRSI